MKNGTNAPTQYIATPITEPAGVLTASGKVLQYQWFSVGEEGTDTRWWPECTGFGDTLEARQQDAINASRNT